MISNINQWVQIGPISIECHGVNDACAGVVAPCCRQAWSMHDIDQITN